ncbi:MAG: peptidylprolyl isomerase [Flavobacteriaceae bacterium]
MKKTLFLLVFITLFLSCEDTKKASTKKEPLPFITETKSIPEIEEDVASEVKKYPKITQENVIEFLTEYGNDNPETKVQISTTYGNIDIKLYKDTPLHRANFLYLVKQGYFDETFFHRVAPNFIIQAGSSDLKSTSKKRFSIGENYRIPYEKGNGRVHQKGTLSGAKYYRKNPDNMSVPFEFFIFLGPKSSTKHLNGNYTIFGEVTKGMDVVNIIANIAADEGEWPIENIYIKAEVIK